MTSHHTNYGSVKSDYMNRSFDSDATSFHTSLDLADDADDHDEKTPLYASSIQTAGGGPRMRKHTMSTSLYASVSKYTTSNYFGFGSTSLAVARMKERAIVGSTTISLADIPSLDRLTPTIVAFFTQLSLVTGLSVFAIPLVVANCGIPMLGGLLLGGILTCYTSVLINRCQYQYSKDGTRKRVYENYIDLGKKAIKWHGDTIMKIIVGSSILTDVYTLIFCAQISKDLSTGYFQIDDRIWMAMWMALVFPLFFIRRMSVLAWLGFFSLVFYTIGFAGIFGLLIYHYDSWTWGNLIPKDFKISYVFIGYGIIVNSYNAHLSMPAIEASMRKPESFTKVNILAFVINTVLKIALSVFAVALFGINTEGSVLANCIVFGRMALVVNVLIAIYMITQYPVSLFVVLEMFDLYIFPKLKMFKKNHWTEKVWLFLSRLAVTVFITALAVSIPNFEMVTGFIGNIRGTLAVLILPIYFYIRIHGRKMNKFQLAFHWFLIVIVTLLGLCGATFAVLGVFGKIY
ncbi:uncharacterized protein [Clytia hemisphaerica]|uniref:Amino acid transporter transmembrane domain-containing protein n=1 Tax=Clytia hemisphaerica TaxID=252671 RepID=A0A7M5VBD6_9CNID